MANIYSEEEWETFCRKCGGCCYEKIEEGDGTIFHTAIPCEHLDEETSRCGVYTRRFEVNPHCVKLTEKLVRRLRWLPPGCGYRKALGLDQDHLSPLPCHPDDLAALAERADGKKRKNRRRN